MSHILDRRAPEQFIRELSQEARLVRQGAAGQEAGPPGLGPEPSVVHQPGGQLLNKIQDPAFDTVEHLFRALPEDSWFSPTTSTKRPIKFEFGVFTVPQSQYFLVTDYEFVALRQSGIDPFDFMEAAPYRFSGFMGFDITLDGRRVSNLMYQLRPRPSAVLPPGVRVALRSSRARRQLQPSCGQQLRRRGGARARRSCPSAPTYREAGTCPSP